jgi:hypothetical protein
MREASSAAIDVEEAIRRLAQEPTPPDDLLRRLREALAVARRMRDHLGTLVALAQERPRDAGPIPAILERAADHLDDAADALNSREPREPRAGDFELDDLLRELDDHLAQLSRQRRGEIAAGAGATALREALVEVAGARHALRAVVSDSKLLVEEACGLTS